MGAGLRLKEILRNRGLTIRQLSEMTDISINTLYSITKRDSVNIDPVILNRITATLHISNDEFWGILPLPYREMRLFDDDPESSMEMDTTYQEYSAFREYLKAMGYRTAIEKCPNSAVEWVIYDDRSNKKYYVPVQALQKLMDSINSYTKFQVGTMISELPEIPKYKNEPSQNQPGEERTK